MVLCGGPVATAVSKRLGCCVICKLKTKFANCRNHSFIAKQHGSNIQKKVLNIFTTLFVIYILHSVPTFSEFGLYSVAE